MSERVEKRALALFNEKMRMKNEKKDQQGYHTTSHIYDSSNFQSNNISFSIVPMGKPPPLMEPIMHVGAMTCKCICMDLTHTFGPSCVLVCLN